jgi:hypothetical protein
MFAARQSCDHDSSMSRHTRPAVRHCLSGRRNIQARVSLTNDVSRQIASTPPYIKPISSQHLLLLSTILLTRSALYHYILSLHNVHTYGPQPPRHIYIPIHYIPTMFRTLHHVRLSTMWIYQFIGDRNVAHCYSPKFISSWFALAR